MASVHISLAAEPVLQIAGFAVTNSIFTSLIISLILITFSIYASSKIKATRRPTGLQNVLEAIVGGFLDLVDSVTESRKKTLAIAPLTLSFFLWILLNNWFGLLPGVGTILVPEPEHQELSLSPVDQAHAASETSAEVEAVAGQEAGDHAEATKGPKMVPLFRPGTADLNTTIALALISVITTQVMGVKYLGLAYFTKFFNLKGINAFVGILELISEFSKIISFAFRLFGNIFAGEVLLTVIAFLIPIVAPIPFIGLEIFVGAIQGLVFAMLSIVFMSLATHGHGAEEH
jgi:F-type H+-transporting ATPase subunit a